MAFFVLVVGILGSSECLAEENAQSWINRGKELSASGNHREAVQAFQKAVQVDHSSEEAYLNLGNSHYELGSYEAAADAFRYVLRINPTNGTAQFYLGLSLIQQKKYDESIPYFEKAGELDSDFKQLSLFYIGKAHSELGNLEAASEVWQKAITVDPNSDIALRIKDLMKNMSSKKAKKKRWAASMSAGIEYDDNVTVSPQDLTTGEKDFAYIFEFAGAYKILETKKFGMEASYDFYQSIYDTLSEFDLQSHFFSLGGTYQFKKFDVDVLANYNRSTLGGEDFMEIYSIAPQIGFFPSEQWFTLFGYSYEDSKFFNDPARDGKNHGVGTDNFVFFMQGKSYLQLSYRFENKDTRGEEFTYFGHYATIGAKTPLPFWNQRGSVNLAYKFFYKDYTNITPSIGQERRDFRHTIQLGVIQPLNQWLALNLNYEFIDSVSNLPTIDFTENIVSAAFSVSF